MVRKLFALAIICIIVALPREVYAQAPVAKISASTTAGCSPVIVNYTDQSTGNPTSWHWDLGNGGTSNLQNPAASYLTPGNYRIILTATNSNGSSKDTVFITVYTSPTVDFTADTTTACGSKTVTFTNQTVAGATGTVTYRWDFGDGDSSTAANPTHTYSASGTYSVTLLATNSAGCSHSITKSAYIKVAAKPTADFTSSNVSTCNAPFNVSFTNTTTGATSYAWDFGDGNTSTVANPTNTYTSTGNYTVRLIATNAIGCKDTITKTNFVNIGNVNANFTADTACAGASVSFTNTSTPSLGTSRLWKFGNGGTSTAAHPTYTYTSAGTYTVTLIEHYPNNCSDTIEKTITVYQKPTVNFSTSDTVGCTTPFTANFTSNATSGSSYLWDFGDGNNSTAANPAHAYTTLNKRYTVQLTAISSQGCSTTVKKSDYIKLYKPTAALTAVPSEGSCPNEPITFEGSLSWPLYPTNYRWDFGDGSSAINCATCSTQTHAYTSTGTYTVQLIISSSSGCHDTITKTMVVSSKPSVAFSGTPLTICPDNPVTFTNSTTGALTYSWNFGDGKTSTVTNPIHIYDSEGQYDVRLIASNNGCKDTLKKSAYVTVNLPLADFEPTFECSAKRTFTFIDKSVSANTYYWDFGDGNTSTTAGNVTHTYTSDGTYTVMLVVYNSSTGCTDTTTHEIKPNLLVVPSISAADTMLCRNEIVYFTRTGPNGLDYYWHFNESTINHSTTNPGFLCKDAGVFDAKLVVIDGDGCTDSVVKKDYIKVGGGDVDFIVDDINACKLEPILFTDNSTTGPFKVTNRYWDFKDGVKLNTPHDTITHVYNNGGKYQVKLVITDSLGCKDSVTKANYLDINSPKANLYVNDTIVCKGDEVQFYNNSGGKDFTSNWKFGDGGTSTNITPKHSYNNTGEYDIHLIITDKFGCKDSITRPKYVKVQQPTADFIMSDTLAQCPPLTVYMTNSSVHSSTYTWSFGNTNQSSNENPSTTYTYPGEYKVELIATNVAGCKDTVTKKVTVKGPTGTLSYTPKTGCNPLNVQYTVASNNTTSYFWDMNNGHTQSTSTGSYNYTYVQDGKYLPSVILTDGAACQVPLQINDTISVDNVQADFTFSNAGSLCNNDTLYFNDTVLYSISGITTRQWTFGDGGTSTAEDPTHYYSSPGTYQIKLTISNNSGCTKTITKSVTIHALPNVNAGADKDICIGNSTALQVTGATSYTWTPTAGLSCTNCANPTASPTTTTTYIVSGTDVNTCTNYDTVEVTVNALPNVNAGMDTSVCSKDSVQLTATGATNYTWTPTAGLSNNNTASIKASPASTTTYTVIGTDAKGCENTDDVTVTVKAKPTVSVGTDKTICNGDSVIVKATGADTYTWTPATTLSCSNCDSAYAKPTTTTTYEAIGTATNGCTDTATVKVNVNALPNVDAGADTDICIGKSTALQATGATSYTWTPATGLSCTNCANPTANPTTTTTYIVSGTDANTCTNHDTVDVTVNTLPNVNAGSDISVCDKDSVQLTATGATNYTWAPTAGLSNNNTASIKASPASTTTYTVTGTDAKGCENTDDVTVTVKPLPVINAGNDTRICVGDTATLTAVGDANTITYSWQPFGSITSRYTATTKVYPTTTTKYYVTGTSNNTCKAIDTVEVVVDTLPIVSLGADVEICIGDSIQLNATGSSVNTYAWDNTSTLSCSSCQDPYAKPITTTTYTVTATDGNGCKNTDDIEVDIKTLPNVTASAARTLLCSADTTQLTATGDPGTTFTWLQSGLSCNNCPNPVASPQQHTTYFVVATGNNSCTDTVSVKVMVHDKPLVAASKDLAYCIGGSDSISASGAVTYTWTPSNGLSCTTCPNPEVSVASTTTYTVTGVDTNGCTNTDEVVVTVNQLPKVNAGDDTKFCDGDSVQLNATGASTYVWSPASGLSCKNCSDPMASSQDIATYTVTGTDVNGCVNTDDVTISPIRLTDVGFSNDTSICIGETVELYAVGGSSYSWSSVEDANATTEEKIKVSPTQTTTYNVVVKQGECFADTGDITVTVHQLPEIDAGNDQEIRGGGDIRLEPKSNNVATYEWSPADHVSCTDCAAPYVNPQVTTTYKVKVTSDFGCEAEDDVTILITCGTDQIFIANTFTPNNDGLNDKFYPQGRGIASVERMSIYTRWGQLVYDESNVPLNNPNVGWDGTFKFEPLKPDVFVYIIKAVCDSGDPIELKGDISLIR